MPDPLCFVLMPFGNKPDATGKMVKFDEVYEQIIKPAIKGAGLAPIRADEELTRGMIHKPMYERLILCEFAVADLTTANPNVFYELGIRHAVRPGSTVLMYVKEGRLPFDVAGLRSLPYEIDATGSPVNADAARAALQDQLENARERRDHDSPIFELLKPFPSVVEQLERNTLQDIEDATRQEEELREAETADALRAFQANLGALDGVESGVLMKLLLAYRDKEAWQEMIDLVEEMPEPLQRTVTVREQLAFALNRTDKREEAEHLMTTLIEERGGSSETYGVLGRVYKDRWSDVKSHNKILARGELGKAIDAYSKGFEADWRAAYPGINAVTLMEVRQPPDERRKDILPVVRYAALRRIASGNPIYWDYATMVELAVLAKNEEEAIDYLAKALAAPDVKEWMRETTLNNLTMIREARKERGEAEPAWIADVMDALAAVPQ